MSVPTLSVVWMSISEWAEVPDNPRQRDTERRASKANRRHLSSYSKLHECVFAAEIDSQIVCKLDGHTRSYLWKEGKLGLPPSGKVLVVLVSVSSMREAKELYGFPDSGRAVKRGSDLVFGATREHGFRLKSSLLCGCAFGYQLRMAETGKHAGEDPTILVVRWKKELLDLDSLDLPKKWPQLISAMLLSIRRDGLEQAAGFWMKVYGNKGLKAERWQDAVFALTHLMEIRGAKGTSSLAGWENVVDIFARAWFAYECWCSGKKPKVLGQANMANVIAQVNKRNGGKRAKSG